MRERLLIPVSNPTDYIYFKFLCIESTELIILKVFFEDPFIQLLVEREEYYTLFREWGNNNLTNTRLLKIFPWFLLAAGVDFRDKYAYKNDFPCIFEGQTFELSQFNMSWLDYDIEKELEIYNTK